MRFMANRDPPDGWPLVVWVLIVPRSPWATFNHRGLSGLVVIGVYAHTPV